MNLLVSIPIIILVLASAGIGAKILWGILRDRARLRRTLDVQMLRVLVPKDLEPKEREEGIGEETKERISVAEQLLSTLSNLPTQGLFDRLVYGKPIVVLEIVAHTNGVIVFYAGAERRFIDHLEKQIYAHYPDADVAPASDYTIFEPGDTIKAGRVALQRSAHLPIATYKELEADPMQALTGALAKIQGTDAAVIQYVLQPASKRVSTKAQRAARRTVRGKQSDVGTKRTLIGDAQEFIPKSKKEREKKQQESVQLTQRTQQRVELVEQKMAQQQFNVNIRIGVSTRQADDAERVYNAIAGAFSQYDLPDVNTVKVVSLGKSKTFLRDLIFRVPREKTSVVLGTTEIASLFHFPLPTTATPNILWRGSKVAPSPAQLPQDGILLGVNRYRGIETPVYFSEGDRRRHMYLIGQTGTGKTTLFLNMIVQDIQAGRGVGVIDPHGELIEDVMLHIPPQRHGDVILFDPKDRERPLGFNILEVKDEAQKDLVVNEVVQILQKLAARLNPESIGPMFEHYLRNALLALAEDPSATLIDVPRMFVDEPFRKQILSKTVNPTVKQFWEKEFAQSQKGQLSADMLSYVISKLGRFISNEVVRNMIGQATSSFDVREVMDQKKILLCNLSKGQLGDINSDLLGFVLVSKIQIAALGRGDLPEDQRHDFYLYLDEFQNFTTDSIATILSEARKYRLDLNLTHQFIQQLDDKIKEAVFGNVGTVVSYRIGVDDAEYLAQQFEPVFSEYDLLNLERFTTAIRLLAQGTPQRPFSLTVLPPPRGGDPLNRDAIRQLSRQRYGRPKAEVEAEVMRRFALGEESTTQPKQSKGGDYLSESLFDVS